MNDFEERILKWIEEREEELFFRGNIIETSPEELAEIVHNALYDLFIDNKIEMKKSLQAIYNNANNTDFVIDEAGKYI